MLTTCFALSRLMRLDKPTGTLLLACPAFLALSQQHHPYSILSIIVICGIILTRSLGCVLNDIADRNIDPFVQRTASRPLASGELDLYQAIILAIVLSFLCISLFIWVPSSAYGTIILSATTILIYPYTKRFITLPQIFLGISFSSSIPVVYAMFEEPLTAHALYVCLATFCWVIGFDTLYALNDLNDDKNLPIQSLPKTFGPELSCLIAQVCLGIAHIIIISLMPFKVMLFPLEIIATSVLGVIIIETRPKKIYSLNFFHLNALLGIMWCILSFVANT